jgi:hypothetical protein
MFSQTKSASSDGNVNLGEHIFMNNLNLRNVAANVNEFRETVTNDINSLHIKIDKLTNDVINQISELRELILATRLPADKNFPQPSGHRSGRVPSARVRSNEFAATPTAAPAASPSANLIDQNPRAIISNGSNNCFWINLEVQPKQYEKTKKERHVTIIWPELVVQAEANVIGEIYKKNKVNIFSQYRLINADHKVYNKLREVQRLLQMALVPYRLWVQKVAIKMNGDFL